MPWKDCRSQATETVDAGVADARTIADGGTSSGSSSPTGSITSDLTSPIVVGREVLLQINFSLPMIFNPSNIAVPVPRYTWRVINRDTNTKISEDFGPSKQKQVIYPTIGHFRVEVTFTDPNRGVTPAVILDQDTVSEDPTLAGVLSSQSDYREAERELINDFRSYVNNAAASTGAQGVTPRFLACILREEIANTEGITGTLLFTNKEFRMEKLSNVDIAIKKRATGANVPVDDLLRSLGVGQVKLSSAAMVLGLIPLIEQDPNNKEPGRTRIKTEFSKLSTTTLTDLFTLLAWPKSNIEMAANYLAKLKNRPNRYPSLSRAVFGTNQRACEIIATEYQLGATSSPEFSAIASDYGQRIWSYMSLPLIQQFFPNS